MAKEQDRKEIVSRIGDAAKLYRDRLVGKRFMYVFDVSGQSSSVL